jgi:hypothetical protein
MLATLMQVFFQFDELLRQLHGLIYTAGGNWVESVREHKLAAQRRINAWKLDVRNRLMVSL